MNNLVEFYYDLEVEIYGNIISVSTSRHDRNRKIVISNLLKSIKERYTLSRAINYISIYIEHVDLIVIDTEKRGDTFNINGIYNLNDFTNIYYLNKNKLTEYINIYGKFKKIYLQVTDHTIHVESPDYMNMLRV